MTDSGKIDSSEKVDSSGKIVSYILLRRLIGLICLFHPVILFFGGWLIFNIGLQPSMSDYYYTGMRDAFVGIDCATGVFFLCYRGYGIEDRIAGIVAGVSAIVVAFFPTAPQQNPTDLQLTLGLIHAIGAFFFLAALAYFSLILFVRHSPNTEPTKRKKLRNIIYRVSGINIIFMMFVIVAYVFIPAFNQSIPIVSALFWMEVYAFTSFGIAWLVKGEALLADN